jgi:hypothetical protein
MIDVDLHSSSFFSFTPSLGKPFCRVARGLASLLPTSAECVVEFYERKCFALLRRGKAQLSSVMVGLVAKHFEIGGRSSMTAKLGPAPA